MSKETLYFINHSIIAQSDMRHTCFEWLTNQNQHGCTVSELEKCVISIIVFFYIVYVYRYIDWR